MANNHDSISATVSRVQLDPSQKDANVMLSLEGGGIVQILGLPFDPPKGLPYDKADDAAVQAALELLKKLKVA